MTASDGRSPRTPFIARALLQCVACRRGGCLTDIANSGNRLTLFALRLA